MDNHSMESFEILKLLSSKLRANILMSLHVGPKKLSDLTNEHKIRSTTILHVLSELESTQFLKKVDKSYELTPIGTVYALMLKDMLSSAQTIEKQKDFWLHHDTSGIPEFLLKSIGDLSSATPIRSETTNLAKVHKAFLNLLSESNTLSGISPIFHIDYIDIFKKLIGKEVKIELIFTKQVLQNVYKILGSDALQDVIKVGKLKLYLRDELNVALTVTDKAFSLGLFSQDGSYDYSMDLISKDKDSIRWGEELFKHYLKGAKKVHE